MAFIYATFENARFINITREQNDTYRGGAIATKIIVSKSNYNLC